MLKKMITPDNEEIIVDFKINNKSYTIIPKSEKPFFSLSSIDYLYNKGKVIIKKEKSEHYIKDWGDGEYTIYFFRNGLPYLLKDI